MTNRPTHWLFLLCATGFLLMYLAPTVYATFLSFDLFCIPPSPAGPTLQWYSDMLSEQRLAGAVLRSCKISLAVAILTALISGLACHSYRQYSPKTQRLLLASALLPLFVPESTHALTLGDSLAQIGLAKTWWSIVLSHIVYITPFVVVIFLLKLSTIEENMDSAARDLGMSISARVLRITVPLVWQTLVFSLFFSFILSFNEYARTSHFEPREMYSVYLKGHLAGGGSQAVYAVSTSMFVVGLILLLPLVVSGNKRHR